MKPTQQTYTLEGIETALRMIEEYRQQLSRAQHNTMPGCGPHSHAVFSYQQLYDALNDIDSAIHGDLEYEDEE
tara:strand:- start:161 stop:379 length:219 start_codon:yes stop_codon:yes gene_type:complete